VPIQSIVYKILPGLYAPTRSAYNGYKSNVNATSANEFLHRRVPQWGHSFSAADIELKGNDGSGRSRRDSLAEISSNPTC